MRPLTPGRKGHQAVLQYLPAWSGKFAEQCASCFEFGGQPVDQGRRLFSGKHLPGISLDFEVRGIVEIPDSGEGFTQVWAGRAKRAEGFGVHRYVEVNSPFVCLREFRLRIEGRFFGEIGQAVDRAVGRAGNRLMEIPRLDKPGESFAGRFVLRRVFDSNCAGDVNFVDPNPCLGKRVD